MESIKKIVRQKKSSRKHPLTLLEILIAVSLAGILFGVLFSKVREQFLLRRSTALIEQECLERSSVQIHLTNFFSRLLSDKESKKTPLFSKNSNLYFKIKESLAVDPAYLGINECTMSLDTKSRVLQIKIKGPQGKERTEVLAKNIKSWTFHFFSCEEKEWETTWDSRNDEAPNFIKIVLEKEYGNIEFLVAPFADRYSLNENTGNTPS